MDSDTTPRTDSLPELDRPAWDRAIGILESLKPIFDRNAEEAAKALAAARKASR